MDNNAFWKAIRLLCQPASLAAMGLLLVNDHTGWRPRHTRTPRISQRRVNLRKRNRLLQLIAIVCLLVIVDQVTKAIVREALAPGDSIPLIGDVLGITFFQNFKGFSWWVPALPPWVEAVLRAALIFMVLLAFPVYIFYTHTRRQSIWADAAVVGIAASGLGHLMDDLFSPYTTDFIQVFHSPSANLADVYSYVGIGALAVETILAFRIKKPQWKGCRHLLASAVRTRNEFLEFITSRFDDCWVRRR